MINAISSLATVQSLGNYKRVEKNEKVENNEIALDRVAEIKKAIGNNQYKINLHETSHKMAQDLLGIG
ncbi:flagellar biosynthesis protein FlgM [Helicobacter pylori]|uniref:flagellar biosynthesis anti-sigma factor FlgM n=1 Tax=Helicobacter pylori TaxID=210 RepID=UPI0007077B4B|nr:flagellar biosynthesis anti-sigma factor FlgM [Helicobacter pylori]OKB16390.1 flagellar biosynthesis protein FlgM [Helicobacter pylori]OKB18271.1 flagellar biosynthesis protein FlgM [Helicobacter pylori]OKB20390.1 flagellar biosynthesis protein FlgM [Helicobacter pylori]